MASLQRAHAALSTHPAERMRAEVFRPTHTLPTRSLAEQVRSAICDLLRELLEWETLCKLGGAGALMTVTKAPP